MVIQHFSSPELPVVVDIGSAQGKFLSGLVRKYRNQIGHQPARDSASPDTITHSMEEVPSVLGEGHLPVDAFSLLLQKVVKILIAGPCISRER